MQTDFLTQFVHSILPPKRKTAPTGWVSFNAPCCIHNGETADTRQRGGLIQNGDSLSYHCFNCSYKTGYTLGRPLSYKFRKWLQWLGASENDIRQLTIQAIRVKEFIELHNPSSQIQIPDDAPVTYIARPLPTDTISFHHVTESDLSCNNLVDAIRYVQSRTIDRKSTRLNSSH